jgi:hypothetical protein
MPRSLLRGLLLEQSVFPPPSNPQAAVTVTNSASVITLNQSRFIPISYGEL